MLRTNLSTNQETNLSTPRRYISKVTNSSMVRLDRSIGLSRMTLPIVSHRIMQRKPHSLTNHLKIEPITVTELITVLEREIAQSHMLVECQTALFGTTHSHVISQNKLILSGHQTPVLGFMITPMYKTNRAGISIPKTLTTRDLAFLCQIQTTQSQTWTRITLHYNPA